MLAGEKLHVISYLLALAGSVGRFFVLPGMLYSCKTVCVRAHNVRDLPLFASNIMMTQLTFQKKNINNTFY
jgi:hypothetical protein